MIKVWRFLSIPVILAVCLGLLLAPGLVSAQAAEDCWLEIDPASTGVGFNENFSVNVTFQNPTAQDINTIMCHVNYTPSLVEVISVDSGAAVGSPFTTPLAAPSWNNSDGWLDYDGGILGDTTNLTSCVFATIHMKSKALAGTADIEFTPVDSFGDPETAILDPFANDHTNWTQIVNGTVTVTGMPVLTVDVDGSGNVTINNTITPSSYPNLTSWATGYNVTLEAIPDAGWTFVNWTGDISGPDDVNLSYVIMAVDKNVTANFAALAPVISVSPTSLNVSALPNGTGNASYTITNSGWGTLNWSLSNVTYVPNGNMSWLTQSPLNGSLAHNMSDTVNVTANATGLAAGTYNATINITGNSSVLLPVTLFVGTPEISVSPASLEFTTDEGEDPDNKTLEVWNSGSGMLNWNMTDDETWLDESPTKGNSTGVGDKTSVNVSVDVSGMEAGDYSATITITDPLASNSPQTVSVSLAIAAAEEVEVPEEEELPEVILGPAQVSASGLSITPQQVQPGLDVTISVNVANTGGETGSYNAVLYINGAVEDSQSVSVAAGASKNVIFTVSKSKAGVYDVSLAGQSGQFEVVGGGGWFGGGLGTGGIIAIVVVVIVLIVAVIFILRGTARPE
jgi:hypothetical protein